jgi:hypothetical protein
MVRQLVRGTRNSTAGKVAEYMVRDAPFVDGLNNAILISPQIEILFQ